MTNKLIDIYGDYAYRLNLLSSGDREKLHDKHFPDSLEFLNLWKRTEGLKIADLGTGGGLPGLVIAEAVPECEFTLIDARQKKVEAVESMAEEAGLENVGIMSGRFEKLARNPDYKDQFDIVVARAVAPLPVLLEYSVGFLKVGGALYAWKGSNYIDEINDAREAMEILEMELEEEHKYKLPSGEDRVILKFVKTDETPEKYPRGDGKPKKYPL